MPEVVVISFLFCYIWALLTLPVMSLGARWPLTSRAGRMRHAALHFCAAIFLAGVTMLPEVVAIPFLGTAQGEYPFRRRYALVVNGFFNFAFVSYWAIIAFKHGSEYYARLQASQLRSSQLETSLRQAELDILRMQLNPHFLFNTLNSIDVLMRDDVATAHRVLVSLSNLLRVSIRPPSSQLTHLRAELQFLEHYLYIEKTRFRDRLVIEVQCDSNALDALVPGFILQPLVENAIRHGVGRRSSNGKVTIRARVSGKMLELQVEDNGPGMKDYEAAGKSAGIGLANTSARLRRLFGDEHVFTIKNVAEGGVIVSMALPLLSSESKLELPLLSERV